MPSAPNSIAANPEYKAIHEAREHAAKRAREAQSAYRGFTTGFILATALAAILSGLVLYGLEADPKAQSNWLVSQVVKPAVRNSLIFLQALSLAGAAFCGTMLTRRNYNEVWTRNRLRAEAGRLERAAAVLKLGHAGGGDVFKQAGRYFNEFVAEQRKYLEDRTTQHAGGAVWIAGGAALIAALTAFASVAGGLENRTLLAFLALLGVCAPALIAALRSFEQATSDAEREALHQNTWYRMTEATRDQGKFDEAIEKHDLDAALDYAQTIFEILREDHAGFAKTRKDGDVHDRDMADHDEDE